MAICEGELWNPDTIDGICFDMDGTLADFYNVEGWLDSLQMSSATPYCIAPPLVDVEVLNELIAAFRDDLGIRTSIISWGSKDADWFFDKQVEKTKRYWLERYLPEIDDIHVVPYGTDKAALVSDKYENPILFDDDRGNCERWYWRNGIVIAGDAAQIIVPTLESLYEYRWRTSTDMLPSI